MHSFGSQGELYIFSIEKNKPLGAPEILKIPTTKEGTKPTQAKLINWDQQEKKEILWQGNYDNPNGWIAMHYVVSRVSDKKPNDAGHPIQYDNTEKQWYAIGAASTITNTIYYGFYRRKNSYYKEKEGCRKRR